MKACCKRAVLTSAATAAVVADASAAVRAWRSERWSSGDRTTSPVDDSTLAERVRAGLGEVEHRLDTPHVHVMVERGVVLLHGDVSTEGVEQVIVRRARRVPGVVDVVSRLHVGLLPGDTRPSDGSDGRSAGARRVLHAVAAAGGGEVTAEHAARVVLGAFSRALRPHARERLASHVPPDVRRWLEPTTGAAPKTVDDLYAAIVAEGAFAEAHTPWVVAAVLRELRAMAVADVSDIAGDLPVELSHLWLDAATAS